MKKITLLLTILISIYFSGIAQNKRGGVKKQNTNFRDSVFPVKSPKQINTRNTSQAHSAKVNQPAKNENVKLDDLKNPFDSGKKIKPKVKRGNYIGETEKN